MLQNRLGILFLLKVIKNIHLYNGIQGKVNILKSYQIIDKIEYMVQEASTDLIVLNDKYK